jgi:hypothetical protein
MHVANIRWLHVAGCRASVTKDHNISKITRLVFGLPVQGCTSWLSVLGSVACQHSWGLGQRELPSGATWCIYTMHAAGTSTGAACVDHQHDVKHVIGTVKAYASTKSR